MSEKEQVFSCSVDAEGIAWLTFDIPGESQNVLRIEYLEEIQAHLDTLEQRKDTLVGVVLGSGKADSFIAGADIDMLDRCTDAAEAQSLAIAGQRLCDRLASFPRPVVAAIHGACLGGGLELALACSARVCTDHPATRLGLPEVQIGVLPGSGGTQRLPRQIGAQAALDSMLTGRHIRPRQAARLGLVDERVPMAHLRAAACRQLHLGSAARWRPGRWRRLQRWAVEGNRVGRSLLLREVRRRTRQRTRGNYPATEAIIDCVQAGLESGFRKGLEAEAEAFGRLAVSPEAGALRSIYYATTANKKERGADAEPLNLDRLGVLGGGLMGAGIAAVSVDTAGLPVRLRDPSVDALSNAAKYVGQHLDRRRCRGSIRPFEAHRNRCRLTLTRELTGFRSVDAVVEAVFEDLPLKHRVLSEVEEQLPEGAVIATNTSSLPIHRVAEGLRHPERLVGLHYFSPVERMPLVEVIPHSSTEPEVVATAVSLARAQGKTPIVVGDGAGFYVNRILAPYLNEASKAVLEGEPIDRIDKALRDYGFPMGPFELLDQVGIPVAAKVAPVLHEAFGERMAPSGVLEKMIDDGRDGRKRGFYRQRRLGGSVPDSSVYRLLGVRPHGRNKEASRALAERIVEPMLDEAQRCLEDGIIGSERDGDLAAVFGIGFPPFRGGPFRVRSRAG